MLFLKVLPVQIPKFWEIIKFAATKADRIEQENLPYYLNELLHSLLSDKAQCFLKLDENRVLISVIITKIIIDKNSNKKYLSIECLYSFKPVNNQEWMNSLDVLKKFAKSEKCEYISGISKNKRVWEIGEAIGFKELNREFILKVE
jgi:hypothetical protein